MTEPTTGSWYEYDHGGNRGGCFETEAEARIGGEEYAEYHKARWSFRYPIRVVRITEQELG